MTCLTPSRSSGSSTQRPPHFPHLVPAMRAHALSAPACLDPHNLSGFVNLGTLSMSGEGYVHTYRCMYVYMCIPCMYIFLSIFIYIYIVRVREDFAALGQLVNVNPRAGEAAPSSSILPQDLHGRPHCSPGLSLPHANLVK